MNENQKNQQNIRADLDKIIGDAKIQGVNANTNPEEYEGLGDVLESTLSKYGITQERFKELFGLRECQCTERKKWLNGILSWKRKGN